MRLVVNANSNICRFYHYVKHPAQLILLRELNHLESKRKNRDITSDRPGHYKAGISARGAYSPHKEAKEVEIDKFSREIANELNKERIKKEYDELIIISPPHITGLLFQHLNKQVKNLIINSIKKDLVHLSDHELLNFLQIHTQHYQK